jgi:hypothetical protein
MELPQLRQTGSHTVLRTDTPTGHTVSIPAHKPLRPGTFRNVLADIAEHKQVSIAEVLDRLSSRRYFSGLC